MLTNTLFRTLISDYSKCELINIDTFDHFLINLNLLAKTFYSGYKLKF